MLFEKVYYDDYDHTICTWAIQILTALKPDVSLVNFLSIFQCSLIFFLLLSAHPFRSCLISLHLSGSQNPLIWQQQCSCSLSLHPQISFLFFLPGSSDLRILQQEHSLSLLQMWKESISTRLCWFFISKTCLNFPPIAVSPFSTVSMKHECSPSTSQFYGFPHHNHSLSIQCSFTCCVYFYFLFFWSLASYYCKKWTEDVWSQQPVCIGPDWSQLRCRSCQCQALYDHQNKVSTKRKRRQMSHIAFAWFAFQSKHFFCFLCQILLIFSWKTSVELNQSCSKRGISQLPGLAAKERSGNLSLPQ